MSPAWKLLATELRAHDEAGHFASPTEHPVIVLVNQNISAKPYQEILIRALDWPMQVDELEFVIRALSERGMTKATARLLAFFRADKSFSGLLWVVGNAIYSISPRDHLSDILEICRRTDLSMSKQMLAIHLSRFKKNEDVFQTLVSLLQEEKVRGHALEALGRYGDSRAIPAIEATPVRPGLYEAHAKNIALKRLRKAERGGADGDCSTHR